jgi:hypothetical protein
MKKKFFYLFVVFFSIFKIFEKFSYKKLEKLISVSIKNSEFQSSFIKFNSTYKDRKTTKIVSKRGYLSINDDGIRYASGFFNSTIVFIPFYEIKKFELTQRIGEVSLTKRSIHLFLKNKEDFYIFLVDGDARKCIELIENGKVE